MKEVESSFLSQEPSENSDPGANVSKDATSRKNNAENGVRVSINGKDDLIGNEEGLEDSEMNGISSLLQMQESKSLHAGLGSVLHALDKREDRSDDGVSLVADVCRDFHSTNVEEKRQFGDNDGNTDGDIVELSDSKDREGEESVEDEGHDFGVGEFVWGKIKSHPWWPGRIYDPVDASDHATKVKQRDKILVAYFGDGTFAWCSPSQLKPLDENFIEMSKQSRTKNFCNALEKTMDEVGRLVDLKMTCSCVPKENLIGFGRTLALNAGIKDGLLVPDGGIDKFSTALFEPAQFLSVLEGIAKVATVPDMLQFAVLRSWLSAFYRAKGGYQLPCYYEPKPIVGLEDNTWVVDLSVNNTGDKIRIQSPVEEDWLSSPTGLKYGQTTESMLHKCQGVPEDGHYQRRRKQKSLAEILDGRVNAEAENKDDGLAEERTELSKAAASAKRKKRNFMGEDVNADGEIEVMGMANAGASLDKSASLSRKKKQKVGDEVDGESKNKMENATKAMTNLHKPSSSEGKKRKGSDEAGVNNSGTSVSSSTGKKSKGSDEAVVNNSGSSDLFSKLGTRKDTQVSESLGAANNKVSGLEAGSSGVKERMKCPLSGGRKKKGSSKNEDGGGGNNQEMKENIMSAKKKVDGNSGVPSYNVKAKEQDKEGYSPRERKISKYLSPPYTNLKGQRKKEMEAESLKVSSEAQLGERMTKAAGHVIGSSPSVKFSNEKFQKKPSKQPGSGHETSDNSGAQTPKQDQDKIDPMMVKAPANEFLSKIRYAALDPLYLENTKSLDMVAKFFFAFRSSVYCKLSDYEMYSEHHRGKKKSQKSELGLLVRERNQTDHSSPDHKSHRTKSREMEEAKLDKTKSKEAASAPDMKREDKESIGAPSAAVLFVTFGPGSSLPSKNDLIKIYKKFGALNEDETEMFYANYCARVVFLNSSEAEEAFNVSKLSSPFGSDSVTFRLRYPSAETKTRELREISTSEPSFQAKKVTKTSDLPSMSQSSEGDVSPLKFVKHKLETITSLLEKSDGKISPDVKSILEAEIKVLLEKVSAMVSSSS